MQDKILIRKNYIPELKNIKTIYNPVFQHKTRSINLKNF